jgi:predicted ribosome quality control (RQC) complex YloA/Tae2 family protein
MSFNNLEVAKAAEIINQELPAEVGSIELVDFTLPGRFLDLNVALRLANKRNLVLSLKSPWTAVFLTGNGAWRVAKMSWPGAFGKSVDWNGYLRGQILEKVSVATGERIFKLHFSNDIVLEVELFPARPNWTLHAGGETHRWKPEATERKPIVGIRPELLLRQFAGDGEWMWRAYQHYLVVRQNALLAIQMQRAQAQLQGRLTQLIKVRGQLDVSKRESDKAEEIKAQGEQLKALLHEYPKNYRTKRLPNSTIELDSKISLADNASRFFVRYKKLQRTRHEVDIRLSGVEAEIKKVTATVARMRGFKREDGEAFEAVFKRLHQFLEEVGISPTAPLPGERKPNKVEKKWEKAGLRRFISKEGFQIWVGRNHTENEELVNRLARGNDMWLHLKGRPGAHVVIQLPKNKTPSLESLLDAATLVVYYSGISERDKVEVDYTFRKYVKRVPGSAEKFLVTYSQNKTLMIKVEQERLVRILGKSL